MVLAQVWGILVMGHPIREYNGAYESLDRPIPVLVNDAKMYIYRHAAKDTWILRNKLTPDKPNCNACIVSEFGPLPLGARVWKVSPAAVGMPKGESKMTDDRTAPACNSSALVVQARGSLTSS